MKVDKNIKRKNFSGCKPDTLPNARAGHPYKTMIREDFLPTNPLAVCWFEGLEKTGLHYFPEKKQITGIPRNSGSYDVQFNIREYNELGFEELSTRTLWLVVEDEIDITIGEVDESDPYWKQDDEVFTIPVNRDSKKRLTKDMVAASKRGYKQIGKGKIREDGFYMRYDLETRWYALAVADGSGKSEFSCKGSEIACNSAVESCLERLTAQSKKLKRLTVRYSWSKSNHTKNEIIKKLHDIIAESVTDACKDIIAQAAKHHHQAENYATTLLMCICKKFDFGWLIGSFGVGDGAVCIYQKENWVTNLLAGGESPSEKCYLTTQGIVQPAGFEQRIRFAIVNDFTALFLMTNGVSDPKFGDEDNLLCFEFWNQFWDDICSQVNFSGKINDVGEKLIKWLDFWVPGKSDDRTIAMLF